MITSDYKVATKQMILFISIKYRKVKRSVHIDLKGGRINSTTNTSNVGIRCIDGKLYSLVIQVRLGSFTSLIYKDDNF